MRLAAVQYRPPKAEPEAARAGLCALVDEAGALGARLIVCPEMATTGYVWESPEEILPHAEPAGGPTSRALGKLAAKHRAWVVSGFAETDGEHLYNSALILTPKGQLLGVYRKVLLYDLDHTWARGGDRRVLVQTDLGVMSPSICMDLNDPGYTQHLAQHRPKLVAFCTNWLEQGHDILPYWRERLGAWRGWFVAANTWGTERGVQFYGRSAILNPKGEAVVMAPPEGDAVLIAEAPDLAAK
ncbi:MAG: carbon-nitrogen hydrolase family protein [Deltaproteobacteria bacterium]|nr:carbon-nitrogen hydrolase family protein [Deltaproteobacteria bacterium]